MSKSQESLVPVTALSIGSKHMSEAITELGILFLILQWFSLLRNRYLSRHRGVLRDDLGSHKRQTSIVCLRLLNSQLYSVEMSCFKENNEHMKEDKKFKKFVYIN